MHETRIKDELKGAIKVPRKEVFAWAMYDFANSTFGTIVATAVFSAYFVDVIAKGSQSGYATLLLTIAMSISSLIVVLTAPVLGCIADIFAIKKRLLLATTLGCVLSTVLLSFAGPGEVVFALIAIVFANIFYGTGENLVAAFLPEIASPRNMGRVSAFGWTIGYIGGLAILGVCLLYTQQAGDLAKYEYVPHIMLITAATFAVAASVTFIFLRERARRQPELEQRNFVVLGFLRFRETIRSARHYSDLFRFLGALFVYSCGTTAVVTLSAVYAQEVMGFQPKETMLLVAMVNIAGAVGTFIFGFVQDRIGSVRTLTVTLAIWTIASGLAAWAPDRGWFWVAAGFVGLAMGSSQSASRALIGRMSPPQRSAEFFGLWGMAIKLAAALGPLTFGLVTYVAHNDFRLAILVTTVFFLAGMALLQSVDEERGIQRAATK